MPVKYKPNRYHNVSTYLVVNNAEAGINLVEKVPLLLIIFTFFKCKLLESGLNAVSPPT